MDNVVQETSLPQKKWPVVIVFISLLVVSGLALYWLMFKRDYGTSTDFFRLDSSTIQDQDVPVQYQKVIREPGEAKITDIDNRPGKSDESLTKVLKGYYHSYSKDEDTITVLNRFRKSSYLQQLDASTEDLLGFYCWPETVEGESGSIKTNTMEFFIYPDGRDLFMPGEKFTQMDLIGDLLDENSFLVVQLKNPFDLESQNLIQKLIVVGC